MFSLLGTCRTWMATYGFQRELDMSENKAVS